jgi:putative phosphoribosyl transferase
MTSSLQDRRSAGRQLAEKLERYANRNDVIVLGLPRGGIPVAYEIAVKLHAPLDALIVRKLGLPGYSELAMGAIASGGVEVVDPDVIEQFGLSKAQIARVVQAERKELQRRELAYRGSTEAPDVKGRTVILVDDGVATGSTMRAGIEAVKRLGAARIVVATGVAPLSTKLLLEGDLNEVVCLMAPREFQAVGVFYGEFPQLTDDDVTELLDPFQRRLHTAGTQGN